MDRDKDSYIITRSKNNEDWDIVAERSKSQYPLVDKNGDNLIVVARLNGVSWQTANAVQQVLKIEIME